MTPYTPTPARRQSGMTLIEVLVAILIFSFGLVGLIGLQARALQYSTSAEDTSRAALLANEMATTMITTQSVNPTSGERTAWATRVSNPASGGLPSGLGSVDTVGTVATITVKWLPPSAASGAAQNQYITQVVLP